MLPLCSYGMLEKFLGFYEIVVTQFVKATNKIAWFMCPCWY